MRNLVLSCVATVLILFSAQSGATPPVSVSPGPPLIVGELGIASWYGECFQGKETASGEPFYYERLTAAHRHLPLGTLVKVTNLRNNRSIELRINDRGPASRDRILDVSYGAAKRLGFAGAGLALVKLEVVRYPKNYQGGWPQGDFIRGD